MAFRRFASRTVARGFQSRFATTSAVALGASTFAYSMMNQVECAGVDYSAVRQSITDILEDYDYDDGSYGPVLVRLAWHSSGSYSAEDGSGGSNNATMRFSPEKDYDANAGLGVARDLLEQVKAKHPEISYADLYTLAGVVAIEEMGGPKINWKPGRVDSADNSPTAPDGRLPDAAQGAQHLRDIFYRMGFNDQEIVALSGAHTLGRCHTDRSGFDGPWTFAPTTFSNLYFQELLQDKWVIRRWTGPEQYEDTPTRSLMMLPTDIALKTDPKFRPWVEKYAQDEELFFKDFSSACSKLFNFSNPADKASCCKKGSGSSGSGYTGAAIVGAFAVFSGLFGK